MKHLEIVEEAYLMLTDKQREVWDLHMRLGMSEYKTADTLKITRNAVHDRLNKARAAFKRNVKELKRA